MHQNNLFQYRVGEKPVSLSSDLAGEFPLYL